MDIVEQTLVDVDEAAGQRVGVHVLIIYDLEGVVELLELRTAPLRGNRHFVGDGGDLLPDAVDALDQGRIRDQLDILIVLFRILAAQPDFGVFHQDGRGLVFGGFAGGGCLGGGGGADRARRGQRACRQNQCQQQAQSQRQQASA